MNTTAIYVTHDQEEALAISDRIAVMAKGRIEQLDHPEEIYSNPRTVFAATFVGTSNHFNGTMQSASEGLCEVEDRTLHVPPTPKMKNGDRVLVIVRPEEVTIQDANDSANTASTGNYIPGVIELRTFLGPFTRFHVRANETTTLTADVPSQQARDYFAGQHVIFSFPPDACQVLPLDAHEVELEILAEEEKV
jgi:putative spermidine/putrescine transport system ATP-binding protein